jgi:hypothetical protein
MTRKPRRIASKPRVALVGDGQTEQIYFANVKDTDRPSDLDLFPDLPMKPGSYKSVLNKAVQLFEEYQYERVYALIDMDKVISDDQQAEYNKNKKATEAKGVIVLENNPCFEFWLLLYFIKTSKSFTVCDNVIAELKKPGRIPGYEKSQRFQVAAKLYANYKDLIRTNAIPGAKLLEKDRPSVNKYFPRSEVYRFFEWYLDPERIALLR